MGSYKQLSFQGCALPSRWTWCCMWSLSIPDPDPLGSEWSRHQNRSFLHPATSLQVSSPPYSIQPKTSKGSILVITETQIHTQKKDVCTQKKDHFMCFGMCSSNVAAHDCTRCLRKEWPCYNPFFISKAWKKCFKYTIEQLV